MSDLIGAKTNLNRAATHINELRRNAMELLNSSPFSVGASEEDDGDLVYRVRIKKAIPLELAAIVGDAGTLYSLIARFARMATSLKKW